MTAFVALDFETANADLSSVCQVGIAAFEEEKFKESWGTLVNPQDEFDGMNVSIHGISEKMVRNSPLFPEVYNTLATKLYGAVVVIHTAFDRTVLTQTIHKHGLPPIECIWLDSAKVVRRTWSHRAQKGYGLKKVCKELGIVYEAHDALEDARAAGEVLIRAMQETGLGLSEMIERVKKPLTVSGEGKAVSIATKGNKDGPLTGQELVFTGSLKIPRKDAAVIAANMGCDVANTIRKTTTLLVVGDQDILKLAGHDKSGKHRKAEELITKGHPIRILRESDFMCLVNLP